MKRFGARLIDAKAARGPLCVGIDPHAALLQAWGLPVSLAGLERFALSATEALAPHVAVLKPQSAFFEVFGSGGIALLERVLELCREAGALSVLDVKRGDIGSTMAAYAQAYLADDAPLRADAITVSPYLGFGALSPALDLAAASGRGVFVLALTSNPEGPSVQHARDSDGRRLGQLMADEAAARNADVEPLGDVGLVVGATIGATGIDLTTVNGPLLAPGIGAQGATAADLRTVFGADLRGVLPSSSREVLQAGPSATALINAAARQNEALRALIG